MVQALLSIRTQVYLRLVKVRKGGQSNLKASTKGLQLHITCRWKTTGKYQTIIPRPFLNFVQSYPDNPHWQSLGILRIKQSMLH